MPQTPAPDATVRQEVFISAGEMATGKGRTEQRKTAVGRERRESPERQKKP